ncbi:hypothetical protein CAEBREN_19110 [Caenorhabditis brenneri]|uniref:F-box domain-containing protein n=1 Tax=Caenorhabditis brenneri TaxID=135651 RepID=G0N383_CAEBE|nr:hypothetical protein CAEBREN_19110 [Caenorhabditis brenneri]
MLAFLQAAHSVLHYSSQKHIHSTFPLYRLPLLPILNVFSSLNTVELFNLSRTSSKLRAFIKTSTLWKRLEIRLLFRPDFFSFRVSTGFTGCHIFLFPRKYEHFFYNDFSNEGAGKEAKVWYKESSTHTYWNNRVLGIETIGNYLLEMFDEPKITITVAGNAVPLIEPVVHWIKKRNIRELSHLSVNGSSKNERDINCILEHFTIRRGLFTNVKLDYSGICGHLRNLDKVTIEKSELLKINDISIINPILLWLSEASLTSQDLNRFLKDWKNGIANSRLKYFRLFSKTRLNKEQVLMDIEGLERSPNEKSFYFISYLMPERIDFNTGGFDIERNDGIKATIHVYSDCFRIVVWPDFRRNMAWLKNR